MLLLKIQESVETVFPFGIQRLMEFLGVAFVPKLVSRCRVVVVFRLAFVVTPDGLLVGFFSGHDRVPCASCYWEVLWSSGRWRFSSDYKYSEYAKGFNLAGRFFMRAAKRLLKPAEILFSALNSPGLLLLFALNRLWSAREQFQITITQPLSFDSLDLRSTPRTSTPRA